MRQTIASNHAYSYKFLFKQHPNTWWPGCEWTEAALGSRDLAVEGVVGAEALRWMPAEQGAEWNVQQKNVALVAVQCAKQIMTATDLRPFSCVFKSNQSSSDHPHR